MWNLKKGHNELLCRIDNDSQTSKKMYGFQRRQFMGSGDVLVLWDGNPIKLDCDDHCTTKKVVKFTALGEKGNNEQRFAGGTKR